MEGYEEAKLKLRNNIWKRLESAAKIRMENIKKN